MMTPEDKRARNAAKQAAWRARQRAEKKRTPRAIMMTDDEAFYIERVLMQMRKEGSVPGQMRRPNGTLSALDA